jgi:anti-sigma B factor antagonist
MIRHTPGVIQNDWSWRDSGSITAVRFALTTPEELDMELKVIKDEEAYIHLGLAGKMDVSGVQEMEGKFISLIASGKKNALVDISGVSFVGSMGLRVFLTAAKSLSWEKKSLILLNPQPMVNEVLEASSFQDVVAIEHNYPSALEKAKA